MASETERKKAAKEAERAEKSRWDDWVAEQEKAGYEVVAASDDAPIGFGNVRVVPASDDVEDLGDGPTYDSKPGG